MVHKIYVLDQNFNHYFKNYDFHNLYKELLSFCTVDLSAFYFDIRKDTLYCDPIKSSKRKSTLVLLNIILDLLLKWFAPILSFTTEEIYKLIYQKNKSIHLEKFLKIPESFKNQKLNDKWSEILKIRNICNISIEEKRVSKEIGSSLEAALLIKLNKNYLKKISNTDMSEICIVSSVQIEENHNNDEVIVFTKKAEGKKCSICWKFFTGPCNRH